MCSVVSINLCVMMSVSGAGGVLYSYKGGRAYTCTSECV